MKTTRLFVAAIAVVVGVLMFFVMNVQAQTPTTPPVLHPSRMPQAVRGAGLNNQVGDPTTAYGQNIGGGGSSFNALDPALGVGDATAAITGKNDAHAGANKGLSTASTNLVVTTTATGAGPDTISLLGDAEQGNGVQIGDTNNGAGGWSLSDGGFSGTATAPGSLSGTGVGIADGVTKVNSERHRHKQREQQRSFESGFNRERAALRKKSRRHRDCAVERLWAGCRRRPVPRLDRPQIRTPQLRVSAQRFVRGLQCAGRHKWSVDY